MHSLDTELLDIIDSGTWSSKTLKAAGARHGLTFDQVRERFDGLRDTGTTEPEPPPEPQPPAPNTPPPPAAPATSTGMDLTPFTDALETWARHDDPAVASAAAQATASLTALLDALSGVQARAKAAARRAELEAKIAELQAELDDLTPDDSRCTACRRTFKDPHGLSVHMARTHKDGR